MLNLKQISVKMLLNLFLVRAKASLKSVNCLGCITGRQKLARMTMNLFLPLNRVYYDNAINAKYCSLIFIHAALKLDSIFQGYFLTLSQNFLSHFLI